MKTCHPYACYSRIIRRKVKHIEILKLVHCSESLKYYKSIVSADENNYIKQIYPGIRDNFLISLLIWVWVRSFSVWKALMPQHDVCQSGVYNEQPNSLCFRNFLLNCFWTRLSSVACCMSVNTQGVKFTKGTYCTFTTRISLPTLQSYFKFWSCMYLTLLRGDSSCPRTPGF